MIVYKNIEAERARNSFSKVEISSRLSVTTSTYLSWIRGIREIPSSKLILMSKIFNTSTDYLLDTDRRINEW